VTDPRTPDLELRLAEWQHDYNWARPHGSLNGQTPIEALCAKQEARIFGMRLKPNMTRLGNDSRSLTTRQT
jgi:hypothetical protein